MLDSIPRDWELRLLLRRGAKYLVSRDVLWWKYFELCEIKYLVSHLFWLLRFLWTFTWARPRFLVFCIETCWRLRNCCSGSCGCLLSLYSLLLWLIIWWLLLPAIRPFYFMSPRKASLTPTFTCIYILVMQFVNYHFCNHTFDVILSPSVVHILSPCCTSMNSCQFTSISSEKKIFVNSNT